METLNEIMEFGRVVQVKDGKVLTDIEAPYAPDLYWIGDAPHIDGTGWELLDGFSGQFRYAGPIMHPSEYIGGRIEEAILEHEGLYCAVVCEDIDDPDNPAGWAVAYREA